MKIDSLQTYNYTQNFRANNNSIKQNVNETKSSTKTKFLVYGLPALGAIGLATFAIIKSKKSPAKVVKEVKEILPKKQEDIAEQVTDKPGKNVNEVLKQDPNVTEISEQKLKEPQTGSVKSEESNIEVKDPSTDTSKVDETNNEVKEISSETVKTESVNSDVKEVTSEPVTPSIVQGAKPESNSVTEVNIKPFSMTAVDSDKSFDGYEKLIYTDNGNGTGHTYQRFYHKDKMYESTVYDEILDKTTEPVNVTRYNYAYENGKLIGIAKQDIQKESNSHGIYNQDGVFEPFPIFVKMKGDKEFKKTDFFVAEDLLENDKRFNPENL